MKLPSRDHNFYCGIDPGFNGAIALMNKQGTTCKVWDMPVLTKEKDRQREIDLDGLRDIYKHLKRLPDVAIGIEWPTTRPGEGAERCERFGRGKGYLHAFAHLMSFEYFLISPVLWKARLGLDGKTVEGANERAAGVINIFYPERAPLILGPRGGILDGRMDAMLIAHFLRTRGSNGLKSLVLKHGKDSTEVQAFILGAGRRKKRRLPRA
jgi:hypothetical protein